MQSERIDWCHSTLSDILTGYQNVSMCNGTIRHVYHKYLIEYFGLIGQKNITKCAMKNRRLQGLLLNIKLKKIQIGTSYSFQNTVGVCTVVMFVLFIHI